jgi:hypothetical protein
MKAIEENRLLEVSKQQYGEYSPLGQASVMGNVFINTIEPENIKAVLATNFKKTSLSELRLAVAYLPLTALRGSIVVSAPSCPHYVILVKTLIVIRRRYKLHQISNS